MRSGRGNPLIWGNETLYAQPDGKFTVEGIDNRASSAHYEFLTEIFCELEVTVHEFLNRIWSDDRGQDIAEYAVMLAVILVLVVGTIRLVGSNANNAFSSVASSIN